MVTEIDKNQRLRSNKARFHFCHQRYIWMNKKGLDVKFCRLIEFRWEKVKICFVLVTDIMHSNLMLRCVEEYGSALNTLIIPDVCIFVTKNVL